MEYIFDGRSYGWWTLRRDVSCGRGGRNVCFKAASQPLASSAHDGLTSRPWADEADGWMDKAFIPTTPTTTPVSSQRPRG